jgi:hypothetical protein
MSTYVQDGSPRILVKKAAFWGVSVRTHAHTPKCGVLPRRFPESLQYLQAGLEEIFKAISYTAEESHALFL